MKNFMFKHKTTRYHLLLKGAPAFIQGDTYCVSVEPDFYQNQTRRKSELFVFAYLVFVFGTIWYLYTAELKHSSSLQMTQSTAFPAAKMKRDFLVDFLNKSLYTEKKQKTSRAMT